MRPRLPMPLRLVSLAPLLGAVLACALKPVHQQDFLVTRTAHFDILSSLGADETRALASDLESFRSIVEVVIGRALPGPLHRTRVYAFDGRRFERPFVRENARGYFRPSLHGAAIVLRAGGGWGRDATLTLRHDFVHHLVWNAGLPQPLWQDEGFAEFSSTANVRGDGVDLGVIDSRNVRLLRDRLWIPMDRVLSARDLEGWGTRDRQAFRAQTWALIHYLYFGNPAGADGPAGMDPSGVRRRVERYGRLIGDDAPPEQASLDAFGAPPAALDRKLIRYLQRDEFALGDLRLVVRPDADALSSWPLPPGEALARLGWLLIDLERAAAAERYFQMAIAAGAGGARSQAGLGAADSLRARWPTAERHYRRALELDADDPRNHVDLAGCYRAQGEGTAAGDQRDRLLALAEREYSRSLEIDAALPDAWLGLGATRLLAADPAGAVAALERARQLLPASLEIALRLGQAHLQLGQLDQALEVAVSVSSRAHDPETAAAAAALLESISTLPRPWPDS